MTYTVRFAHLETAPVHKLGDTIKFSDTIGRMGKSGKCNGAHLHIDCVEGMHTGRHTLAQMESGYPKPAPRQLNYFIDHYLFGIIPYITTYYNDYRYQEVYKKVHPGYDVVPQDRGNTTVHFNIRWNRSMTGRVVQIIDDPTGYGHCIYIAYEV